MIGWVLSVRKKSWFKRDSGFTLRIFESWFQQVGQVLKHLAQRHSAECCVMVYFQFVVTLFLLALLNVVLLCVILLKVISLHCLSAECSSVGGHSAECNFIVFLLNVLLLRAILLYECHSSECCTFSVIHWTLFSWVSSCSVTLVWLLWHHERNLKKYYFHCNFFRVLQLFL